MKQGEILIDIDVIDDWNEILQSVNTGKTGTPYVFPLPLMILINQLRHYHMLSYRDVERIMDEMAHYISGIEKPNYSTICKRMKSIKNEFSFDDTISLKNKMPKGITILVEASKIEAINSRNLKVYLWKATKMYRKIFFCLNDKGHVMHVEIS